MEEFIKIQGARQHNLKNLSVKIPKNKLVVFTGLSGSGKSSLAFDTIYAEGQRRYVESLSSYARQFLGIMDKPEVDQITGLSPAIAIDQKSVSHNPRSTVGTITEIYDYLRLLYSRAGRPHCPRCGREISQLSLDQIINQVTELISRSSRSQTISRFIIFSPVVREKKGTFADLFKNLIRQGFSQSRIDGRLFSLAEDLVLIKTNRHNIDVVIDRITVDWKPSGLKKRLFSSLETALKLSNGLVIISQVKDKSFTFPKNPQDLTDHLFSTKYACPDCNISLMELEPRIFSFNSPQGACPVCSGLGMLMKIDPQKLLAPQLTLAEGAIIPFAAQLSFGTWLKSKLEQFTSLQIPWKDLSQTIHQQILYGNNFFEGIIPHMERRFKDTNSEYVRLEFSRYMTKEICPACHGSRLKPESLSVTLDKLNIYELTCLSIKDTREFLATLRLSSRENQIAAPILKEILTRLNFLLAVGLDYLSLSRESTTLAGGEAQRIRLASQIGSGLTNVLYVLDEPSIGLHQRDNQRLINTLKNLRDLPNSIIVVEHDREVMLQSDYLVDFGPLAGKLGGEIVSAGTVSKVMKDKRSLTGQYLSQKKSLALLSPRLKTESFLTISGCHEHNLKNINIKLPLNNLIVITGVSGSGKSTLVHDTLYPALKGDTLNNFTGLTGEQLIHRTALIDQSPIGRTPRSNPATYTKAFDFIRFLFSQTKDAKISGFSPSRFSFNLKDGRCEACQGEGQVRIPMQFMADVFITCEVCRGSRYNAATLAVKYQEKNIAQVLNLTVDEALKFFPQYSPLYKKLITLQEVGLGYISLGQPAPTLSGGEAQRVKLAKELSVHGKGQTLYLLDEPTTGLHFEDLKKLLLVLRQLVNQGHTVVVIEHNLDIVKNADWIIDLGPEGGDQGGRIVAQGTPKDVSLVKASYTGQFLKKRL